MANLELNKRTLLGSKDVKASWLKKGTSTSYPDGTTISTKDQWIGVSGAYTISFYATLTEQSTANNNSTVKFEHVITANGNMAYSGYSNARSIIAVSGTDKSTKYIPTVNYNGVAASVTHTYTETFSHGSNGKFTEVAVSARWRGTAADSDSYAGGDRTPASNTINGSINVPDIARADTLNVNKTFISKGEGVTFSTSNTSGLATKCEYKFNGGTIKTVWAAGAGAKSVSKTYQELTGTTDYTTGTIIATMYTYGNTAGTGSAISTSSVTIYVQGQGVPLSLYQQGNSVGASIGQEATGPGFYVNGTGPFTVKTITIGGVTYNVLAL